jgi:hypothetical protein
MLFLISLLPTKSWSQIYSRSAVKMEILSGKSALGIFRTGNIWMGTENFVQKMDAYDEKYPWICSKGRSC